VRVLGWSRIQTGELSAVGLDADIAAVDGRGSRLAHPISPLPRLGCRRGFRALTPSSAPVSTRRTTLGCTMSHAGDIAAFIAAGASTATLGTSIYIARMSAMRAERLEARKWSRERLADSIVLVAEHCKKFQSFGYQWYPVQRKDEMSKVQLETSQLLRSIAVQSSGNLMYRAQHLSQLIDLLSFDFEDPELHKGLKAKFKQDTVLFEEAARKELGLDTK
jgi:hypothetical protein